MPKTTRKIAVNDDLNLDTMIKNCMASEIQKQHLRSIQGSTDLKIEAIDRKLEFKKKNNVKEDSR